MKNNYGVFYPYDSFNIGQRFFFFNSLEENIQTEKSSNYKSGSDLAAEVSSAISSHMDEIDPSNKTGLDQIKNVLNFLQSVIEYERASEERYFKSYLEKAELPSELKKEFLTLRDPKTNAFDYIKFINLINILYNGIDGYKAYLQYEGKRLEQINTVINKFLSLDKEEQKVLNKKTGQKEDKGFYANFRNYLWKNSSDELVKIVNNTKTFSNRIQEKISSAITNFWDTNEWKKTVYKFLRQRAFYEPIDDNTRRILTIQLISECLPKIKAAATEELIQLQKEEKENNFIDATKLKNIIRKEATDYIHLNLMDENSAYISENLQDILNSLEKNKTVSLNNDTKRYIKLTKGINIKQKKEENIIALTKEAITILKNAIKQTKHIPAKKEQDLINQFVEIYTENNAIQLNHTLSNDEIIDLISNNTDIGKLGTVVNFYISSKDNLVSEGFATGDGLLMFESDYVLKQAGLAGGYQKMDAFAIKNFDIGNIIVTLDDKQINSYFSSLCNSITKTYFQSIEIQKDNPIIINNKLFNEKQFRNQRNFGESEFMIQAETKRRLLMIQQLCNEAREELIEANIETETINKIINSIKNTIQISTTVKSYNRYNNNQGFHGGSLGGSVETQLKNIYKMFSYGGVSLPDLEWMIFAVYNSGDNMIGGGENTRNSIENILSTVAGMLLFDDAGEQALYIQSQAKKYTFEGSSNYLHLYHLNDFYFPSSFILQLTYNGLLKSYNLLQSEFSSFSKNATMTKGGTGANIKIINNIPEPSENTDETSDWINYFNNNKKKVALTITFLGGLLDIIDELNTAMNSYE